VGEEALRRWLPSAPRTVNRSDTCHATSDRQAAHEAWREALTVLDELNRSDADQVRTRLAAPDPT